MLIRNAKAEWQGDLLNGSGQLSVGSGALDVPYSVKSRLEDGQSATNPEELLGASHAGRIWSVFNGETGQFKASLGD